LLSPFSGGSASTPAIRWLIDRRGVDVVAVVLDLQQGRELDGIRERALAAGATRCHVLDMVDAFARDIVWPVVRAGAVALPTSALSAPLIARSLVEMARLEQALGVAHGAIGQAALRQDTALATLAPPSRVVGRRAVQYDQPSQEHALAARTP
jgi:argininosuccinate synthase